MLTIHYRFSEVFKSSLDVENKETIYSEAKNDH